MLRTCLLNGDHVIKAMNLQQVDIRGIQALQRFLNLVENGGTAEAEVVLVVLGRLVRFSVEEVSSFWIFSNSIVAFRKDHKLVAW